jgi:hypothetical protein
MKPSGAHTHPDSAGGIGAVVAVVVAGAVITAIAGPVIQAVTALVQLVLVIAAVLAGLTLAAVTAVVVWRVRRGPRPAPWATSAILTARPVGEIPGPAPRRAAGPREVHLHLHGASALDIAAALAYLTAPEDAAQRPQTAPAAAVTAGPGKRSGEPSRRLLEPGGRR